MSLSNTVFYFDGPAGQFTFSTSASTINYATYSSQMTVGVVMIQVDIGTSCTTIAEDCFNQTNVNDKLVSITFLEVEASDNALTIGARAFQQLNNATTDISIIFPVRLVSLGDSCFYNSLRLISIYLSGTNVTTIENSCFDTCANLASAITIPSSVTTLGFLAFYACSSIPSVTFENGSTLTSIPEGFFGGCANLTSVNGIPNTVTTIDRIVFQDCAFGNIILPTGLLTIGELAFDGCTSLTSITIPEGVTTIGVNAFHNNLLLSTINLPSSLTTIDESAFYYIGTDLSVTGIIFNVNDQTQMTNASLISSSVFQSTEFGAGVASYPPITVNAYNVPGAPSSPTLTAGFEKLFNPTTQTIPTPTFNYFSGSSCFHSDTSILCYDPSQKQECWREIDTLKRGDLVKTYMHGYCPISMIGWNQCKNIITKTNKYCNTNMYISKNKKNALKVTGGHGVMKTHQEMEQISAEKISENSAIFGHNVPIIENHILFLVRMDEQFEELPHDYSFKYYHFVLETSKDNQENQDDRFCVWARDKNSHCTTGILTETPSKKHFCSHNYIIE